MFFETKKTRAYQNTRSLLIRHMADYSNTASAPRVKGGWYALVTRTTGEVWLAETVSYAPLISRYRKGTITGMPDSITAAMEEGQELDLWLCTKPGVDIEELRDELEQRDQLLQRAVPNRTGGGKVLVIRHDVTHNYFLTKTRDVNKSEFHVLSHFLVYISKIISSQHPRSNQLLQKFVTDHAQDVLKQQGFTVAEVARFKTVEEAIEIMENYAIDSRFGRCMNSGFTRH